MRPLRLLGILLPNRCEGVVAADRILVARLVSRTLPIPEGIAVAFGRLEDGDDIARLALHAYIIGASAYASSLQLVNDAESRIILAGFGFCHGEGYCCNGLYLPGFLVVPLNQDGCGSR